MSEADDLWRHWWQRTWQERHDAIEDALGPIESEVASFSWPSIRVPGACALTLPPVDVGSLCRPEWLYLSMGMSQPLSTAEDQERRAKREAHSGFGYEFALLADRAAPWAPELLYEMITYFTDPKASVVGWGDRIVFGVYMIDGAQHSLVGAVENRQPIGDLRALLVWPYRRRRHFLTSTGKTDLLVAIGITGGEWELAKSTTSQHLVLLLEQIGIGQKTDLSRICLTRDSAAMAAWSDIKNLDAREAWNRATSLVSAPAL